MRDQAHDLSADAAWEIKGVEEETAVSSLSVQRLDGRARSAPADRLLDDPHLRSAREKARSHPAPPPHLLSQTNRGLRMILVSAVLIVAVSWAATVGQQYIAYLKIQELSKGDPDAMRVMCAVQPPSERDIGMMHLCELAAKGAAKS